MTREELVQMREYKVAQASTEYWNKNKDNDDVGIITAFEDGVAWADAHPENPWISVEERLPEGEDNPDEYNAPHRARSSSNVIITDGTIINRGYYSYARMRWEWNEGEINVTHWMPIQQIKKGE